MLLVVIYHSGLALPGGAIGVDIFFVISGFVITGSILRGWKADHREGLNSSGLRSFLTRRARRILPNYCVVLSISILASSLFFDPYAELPQIQITAIASFFFSANLHLFLLNSYDGLLEHPLRHLWSLGVEEHFLFSVCSCFSFDLEGQSSRLCAKRSVPQVGALPWCSLRRFIGSRRIFSSFEQLRIHQLN